MILTVYSDRRTNNLGNPISSSIFYKNKCKKRYDWPFHFY